MRLSPFRAAALSLLFAGQAAASAPDKPKLAPAARGGLASKPGAGKRPDAKDALTAERALEVRWPSDPVISPDGTRIVFQVRTSDREANSSSSDLWVVPIGGGTPVRLTRTGGSNTSPAWSPDGSRLAFISRREGGGQLFVMDMVNGGDPARLTDLPGGASAPAWSPDGSKLAFTSMVFPECTDLACNRRKSTDADASKLKARAFEDLLYRHWDEWDDGRRWHLFVVDAEGKNPPVDVTPGPDHAPTTILSVGRGFDWVGSDRLVVAINPEARTAVSTNSDLFLVSASGGPLTRITTNRALDGGPVVSPDGRYIAYVAHTRAGFESDRASLMVHDVRAGTASPRTDAFDRSVEEIAWMPDGAGLYFTAQNHGYAELYSVGREAGEPAAVVPRRSVHDISVGPRGSVVFTTGSYAEPPELAMISPANRGVVKLTKLNEAFVSKLQLGAVEEQVVQNGAAQVHGFVVYPPGFDAKQKYPLVVLVHGGPQGAWNSDWGSRWNPQLFAAQGYVVALPNFRGSTGYGQQFTDAVSRNWGGAPFEDIMAFTEAMLKKPFMEDKACAAGASYGGYMVNWINGHTTRFKCLITHAGIFNLESFYGATEELWFPDWDLGGPPWQKREDYARWSPHASADKMRTPTLVSHGELDYRTPLGEGLQAYTTLKRNGVATRLVYFPDEGHWVRKPQSFVFWYAEMLGWLRRYL